MLRISSQIYTRRKTTLKIEKEFIDNHQVSLTVEADGDQFESMKRRAARKIAKRIKIPGFRPGKAPYQVIVRNIGEGSIIEEALEMYVNDIYPKVLDEAEIQPYGPGSLDDVVSMDPPVLKFIIPLEAEVVLGNYHAVRKTYEPTEVSDEDVDQVLENLRERQAVIEPVDRPASTGDLVTVKVSANRIEESMGEDDDLTLIEERSMPIIINSDDTDEDEWPFPGFSQNIIDLSEGDEKSFSYSYPEDSEPENFRGVEAEFHVVVESVKERTLPELDEEFVASLGEFETIEELRAEIHSSLEEQEARTYNENYDDEVLAQVIEESEIKYPPQMLESEIDSVIRNFEQSLGQQGLDLDLYLKTRSLDMDGLREEVIPTAEERLKRTLVLLELAKAEDLQVDPEQVQVEAQMTMSYLSQSMTRKDVRKLNEQGVYANILSNITADLILRESMDRLRNISSGKLEEEQKAALEKEEKTTEVAGDTDDQVDDVTDEISEGKGEASVNSETDAELETESESNEENLQERPPAAVVEQDEDNPTDEHN